MGAIQMSGISIRTITILLIALTAQGVVAQEEKGKSAKKVVTLEDCLELSRLQNNDILKAREEIERTRGIVKEGRSAAFPHIDAAGKYTKVDDSVIEEIEGVEFGTDEIYDVKLSLDQKLYSGGKVGAGIRGARLVDQLSRVGLLTTMRNVEFDVKLRFYAALLARDLIEVQIESVRLFEENLENVKARAKEGQASEYEVLRAKVALRNIQPDLIRAKNNYRLALDALKRVLNLPLETEIETKGELSQSPMKFALDALIETAMANRSEIAAQEINLKLRREKLIAARSGKKPEVSLFGNYGGVTRIFGSDDPTDLKWGWEAGVNVSLPVFDGFETKGKTIQAEAELKQARIELDSIKDGIELEVRQAYFKFNEAVEVLESQQENVKEAEESVRQSEILAKLGQITQFALRDAQLQLRAARTNLKRALHEYNIAHFRLEKATGYDVSRMSMLDRKDVGEEGEGPG